jgi:hypothetical protein
VWLSLAGCPELALEAPKSLIKSILLVLEQRMSHVDEIVVDYTTKINVIIIH